ncbi:MAG: hypothetical protein IJ696_05435 [Ruminococcus sp.]|nr:hypothetical protein [Ruminococcus sp.]
MNLSHLEAVLYFDKVTVKGIADISLTDHSCAFRSDFVPILHFGSEVTIVTKINGIPFLKVTGAVYLSSKRFMRVQPITLALFKNAERLCEVPVRVPAEKISKRLFSGVHHSDCTIVACSAKSMTVTGDIHPDRGDGTIELYIEGPMFFDGTTVKLKYSGDGMIFGRSGKKARYIYKIVKIEKRCYSEYMRYIRACTIDRLAKSLG